MSLRTTLQATIIGTATFLSSSALSESKAGIPLQVESDIVSQIKPSLQASTEISNAHKSLDHFVAQVIMFLIGAFGISGIASSIDRRDEEERADKEDFEERRAEEESLPKQGMLK